MGYSAVKGGLEAIAAAEALAQRPEWADDEPALVIGQLEHQLSAAVDKVMGEGGLYAPELAALACKQAEGDLFEAAFLLRAYRSTLPRLGYGLPVVGSAMRVLRRISSAFKDVPGGQLLGRTRDYTQRLLDFGLLDRRAERRAAGGVNGETSGRVEPLEPALTETPPTTNGTASDGATGWPDFPSVSDALRTRSLLPPRPAVEGTADPPDITLEALRFPAPRAARLQALARGESGAMLALAYSNLRGYGARGDHATVAGLRVGELHRVVHPLTGQPVTVGWYRATEVELLDPAYDRERAGHKEASFELSYGLVFGQHERKAISMAILDAALRPAADSSGQVAPSADQELVLSHIDSVESSGFVEHLKLPHYVTFGSLLQGTLDRRGEDAPAAASARETVAVAAESDAPLAGLHHHGDGVLHAHDQ